MKTKYVVETEQQTKDREIQNREITVEQIQAGISVLEYLKENKQVLDPVAWKRGAIKANYGLSAIPVIWGLLEAFGVHLKISAEYAGYIFQALVFLVPVLHNMLLSATSKNVTMDPTFDKPVTISRDIKFDPSDFTDE